jgi:thiol:disulfide interchange protein DsbA
MKRRDFFAGATSAAVAATVLPFGDVWAQAKAPTVDKDYVKLDRPAPVDVPTGQIELLEFFWYGCPHCNAFEPVLGQWIKKLPKEVAFKRVPIAFREDFVAQQHLFYALEAMGLVDKLHVRVFAAIHSERQSLVKPEAIMDWVAKQGVDTALFTKHFNSFTTASKARRASQLMSAYQLEGVPALGVAGRFYTDGAMAKSMDRALQVVEFLLAEVRAGR